MSNPCDGCMAQDEEMVQISKEEYDELQQRERFLNALLALGVDNWDGYEAAQEMVYE